MEVIGILPEQGQLCALLRPQELGNFQISQTGSGVTAEFDCTTIYGPDKIAWDFKGVKL